MEELEEIETEEEVAVHLNRGGEAAQKIHASRIGSEWRRNRIGTRGADRRAWMWLEKGKKKKAPTAKAEIERRDGWARRAEQPAAEGWQSKV